jgi:DNA ligase (NAD+)
MEQAPESLRQRLEALRSELHYHNYRYHVLDDPVISDPEFDQLLVELRQLEEENPDLITPDSPTQRAGSTPSARFVRVRHPAPILSLPNAFNADGVRAWYERIRRLDDRVEAAEFVVEPKIDGLTVVLHYENGRFVRGTTRGDGEVGEDISSNLRTVRPLPLRLPAVPNGPTPPARLVVRGEAFMTIENFERLNARLQEAGEKTYLNPRNTAAGSLRQLDSKLTASRPLDLLTYSLIDGDGDLPTTQWDTLQLLKSLGFPTPQARLCATLDETIATAQEWADQRSELAYEADGMVIKINDLRLAQDLGYVGKDPRGAIAFKFPAQEVITTLHEIGVNVGRTGRMTPFAVLEPVEIGGVIVKQATLHNFDYIAEKDIRPGDRVRVKRAGEVIPYVIGPVESARTGDEVTYQPPSHCPACLEELENLPGEVDWFCVNSACPAQLIRNLEHFVSRGAMDIVGMGIKIVEQLIAAGLLHDVADLYSLQKEDLLQLEGFAEKKVDNLLEATQASKDRPLSRVITALGIHGVGGVSAADLARYYPNLERLAQASDLDLQRIEGIGPNIARAIVEWFERPRNQEVLRKLKLAGVWPQTTPAEASASQPATLEGMTFVVTGTLPNLNREEARTYIQSRGGKVTDSISKKTSYLVLGENPGSKYDKAKALSVPIIDEAGLRQLGGE